MVHEYFVRAVQEAHARHVAAYQRLQSADDAHRYVESVRERIRTCFGPEPERTPLAARITGTVERDAYRIEKVLFESRPSFPITANLYLPTGVAFPRPAVVGSCGHSANGKAFSAYQSFAQGLARLGYVCLLYDPLGQGERLQYTQPDLTSRLGPGVAEHLVAGNQQFLVGEFLGMWRAWDGIRALDYLLSRPEVDPRHVGITGNSGGGTLTTWLCGLDPRWTMAAPACFVTTFRHNMENELPADTEQCPPRALALALDHVDFLAAMAPKPVEILAQERDFFDVRGSQEAADRLKKLYRLLDAEQDAALHVGPNEHGFSQENREAMYSWFGRATGQSDAVREPTLTLEDDRTLWCTPQGQVAALENTRTVFWFTREKSRQLAAERGQPRGDALRQAVANVLKLSAANRDAPGAAADFRILRPAREQAYPVPFATTYAIPTEPGILALVYMLTNTSWAARPPRGGPVAHLYVAHRSSDRELREDQRLREAIASRTEAPWFTCDVRGIGESQPNTCGDNSFDDPYGCDYFYAIHSLMLDRPYVGQKTHDLLCVLEWLATFGYTEIHLSAKGWGCLPATFAALLSPRVTQVTLVNPLRSYAEVAETEDYREPLSTILPDVLAHFDLPDCYAELEAKQLEMVEERV
jgi:cephalosporin-C deacetylase-like acetyl esterase